jgi:hypothetical protein
VTDERDETIDRIAAALQELPEVNPAARARVLVAVASERQRDRERAVVPRRRLWRAVRVGLAAAATLALLTIGWQELVPRRGADTQGTIIAARSPLATARSPLAGGSSPVLTARAGDDASMLQPVQFVFRAPSAKRVSVVGDFTEWDAHRAVMTRDTESGLWSATIALPPGRHIYAFILDDSVWVRDPRAPVAPDADFGRPGSILLVGRP